MERLREAWPHIRALLVLLHCVAVFVMAFPAPGGAMSKSAWKDPTVQGEFAAWTARLNSLGWSGTQQDLEDQLFTLSASYMDLRSSAIKPFKPYYRYAGTGQSWRMFVAPHRFPARLHIDVREHGEWRTVYVARSSEYDWMAPIFDYDRMRSATFRYAWRPFRRYYRHFCEWLAVRAREDFPDATELRVRFFKYQTPTPAQTRAGEAPEGKYISEQRFSLK